MTTKTSRHAAPDLAELRRLLAAYRAASGLAPIVDAWYAVARAAHAALPALLDAAAERDALAAKVERVRALHYAADNDVTRTPACEACHGKAGVHECGCWAPEDRQPVCGHCNEGDKGISVAWPCPTIRAIGAES